MPPEWWVKAKTPASTREEEGEKATIYYIVDDIILYYAPFIGPRGLVAAVGFLAYRRHIDTKMLHPMPSALFF